MDLKIENESANTFDLVLDSQTDDLAIEKEIRTEVFNQVVEAFDMSLADDIDFPDFYSKQRDSMNSEDFVDENERLVDAENILLRIPEIDSESIEVEIQNKNVATSFKLVSGESLKRLL